MMRTIIDLTDEQVKVLAEWCRREQISRAEAIRRAVDAMLKESRLAEPHAAFGIWRHKRLNARRFVDRVRAEWDR